MGFIGVFLLLMVFIIFIFGIGVVGFCLLVAGIIMLIIKCNDKTEDPIRIRRNHKFKIAGTIMTIIGVVFVIPATFLTIYVGVKLVSPTDGYVECEEINCEYDSSTYQYSFNNDNVTLVPAVKYIYNGKFDDLTPKYSIKSNKVFKSMWFNLYSYEYNGYTLHVAYGEDFDYTIYVEASKLDDFEADFHKDCLWTVESTYTEELSNIVSKYYASDNLKTTTSLNHNDIYYCYSRSSDDLIAGDMVYFLQAGDNIYFSNYFNPDETRYVEVSSEDAEIIKKVIKF